MSETIFRGIICVGAHQAKQWTRAEIREHIRETVGICVDCLCGVRFRRR